MKRFVPTTAALCLLISGAAGEAVSQDTATPETVTAILCTYGPLTFSPGASILEGDHTLTCAANSRWFVPNEPRMPNCLYANRLYSKGAVILVGTKTLACTPEGVWK